MKVVYSNLHRGHVPGDVVENGVARPSRDVPERLDALLRAVRNAGLDVVDASDHGRAPLAAVHSKRGVDVSTAPPELIDAVLRLACLLNVERETDRHILAPLAEREIIYRLLMGEQADRLQQIAFAGSKLSQINRAIAVIKENYAQALRVEELAARVNMSVSSFHEHFRTVTSMSPLQYQKHIRLQEARRLLLAQGCDAATAGFAVGYESPSHFSREYSRQFGLPPKRDIEKMRGLPAFV